MKTARWIGIAVSVTTLLITSTPAFAQTDTSRIAELEARMAVLAEQFIELRAELDQAKEAGETATTEEVQSLRTEVALTRQLALQATQSGNVMTSTSSTTHLAGYASAEHISPENGNSAFTANFNPMFHYQGSN